MRRDEDKEKFWRKTVAEARGRGQSVRAFCRERGLKESLFYAWRRELKRREGAAGARAGFVELVRASEPQSGAGVSIRLGERVHIVLDRGFDEAALKAVLAAMGEAGWA